MNCGSKDRGLVSFTEWYIIECFDCLRCGLWACEYCGVHADRRGDSLTEDWLIPQDRMIAEGIAFVLQRSKDLQQWRRGIGPHVVFIVDPSNGCFKI